MHLKEIKFVLNVYFRKLLQWVFKFDKWHVAPLSQRKYCHKIITKLNAHTQRKSVIDIGCGLGDILSKLNYASKLGVDAEKNVIRAASFISNIKFNYKNTSYVHGSFPNITLNQKFDAVIMVNWIHNIKAEIVASWLTYLYENYLNNNGVLVIDIVKNDKYRYNHQVEVLLANITGSIVITNPLEYGRRVVFVTKG